MAFSGTTIVSPGSTTAERDTTDPQRASLTALRQRRLRDDEYHLEVALVGWAARLAQIPAHVVVWTISDGI